MLRARRRSDTCVTPAVIATPRAVIYARGAARNSYARSAAAASAAQSAA